MKKKKKHGPRIEIKQKHNKTSYKLCKNKTKAILNARIEGTNVIAIDGYYNYATIRVEDLSSTIIKNKYKQTFYELINNSCLFKTLYVDIDKVREIEKHELN
ncbi:hypothetical protein CDIK_1448 [Cucumispora dikerogammari]|nr:hypothetical protein CDIK_1448 [Cucumispora dikerogammari]